MTKDPSIPRRNKAKASVRKTKSSSDTTVTPLTAAAGSRLSTSAKGKQPAKASKAKSLTVLFELAMTEAEQVKLAIKRSLQQTHISQASGSGVDEGTDDDDVDEGSDDQDDDDDKDDDNQDNDNQDEGDDDDNQDESNDDDQDFDDEGKEFIHPKLSIHDEKEDKDEESFDPIAKTLENSDDEGNDDTNLSLNVRSEEGDDAEDDEDELYGDVNINLEERVVQMVDVHTTQEFEDTHVTLTLVNPDSQQQILFVSSQFVTSMLNPTPDARINSLFETTSQMDVQAPTTVAPLTLSAPTLTPSTIATTSTLPQAPTPPTTAPSTLLQDLPNFVSLFGFNHRLKTLEANFSEFIQTNQFAGGVSSIHEIVQRYMDQQMNEALKIEKTVNELLEAEVLTQSSNSSKTSYVVTVDLTEIEFKKILIEKMEGNKSIHQSDKQRNLYKALVEAYESDKIILDTYGDTIKLKRRRDDDVDKDEETSAGSNRGSKRRREGKDPESTSAPKEKATRTTGAADDQPVAETSQHPEWFPQQKKPLTPYRDWNKTLPASHGSIQPWISELAKQTDSRSSFNELMDTPVDFSAFLMNRLKVDTLTLELLAGPTYELMKVSCKSLVELEFFLEEVYKETTDQLAWINPERQQYPHNLLKPLPLLPNSRGHCVIPFNHFINNDLEYLRGGASSRKSTTFVTKTKAADYGHIKWIEDLVPRTMWSQEPMVEWHNYKQLDWITMRRDDDKLYKFKKGDFKRLRIQDIEDMLLLLVQEKLTNLTVEERFAFNVSFRMFTRSIVIQRHVEDLQLDVKSYQKKLNLTRPDTYRFDLKRKEAYTAYSNPRGFIYQNKEKHNRLMRIDELHKFSDGTLNDVRTALDDRLKGIRLKYLPQTIWRKSDKERAAAMI
nr:hypothetical protein [Tanacetum cinerariifolium]